MSDPKTKPTKYQKKNKHQNMFPFDHISRVDKINMNKMKRPKNRRQTDTNAMIWFWCDLEKAHKSIHRRNSKYRCSYFSFALTLSSGPNTVLEYVFTYIFEFGPSQHKYGKHSISIYFDRKFIVKQPEIAES